MPCYKHFLICTKTSYATSWPVSSWNRLESISWFVLYKNNLIISLRNNLLFFLLHCSPSSMNHHHKYSLFDSLDWRNDTQWLWGRHIRIDHGLHWRPTQRQPTILDETLKQWEWNCSVTRIRQTVSSVFQTTGFVKIDVENSRLLHSESPSQIIYLFAWRHSYRLPYVFVTFRL